MLSQGLQCFLLRELFCKQFWMFPKQIKLLTKFYIMKKETIIWQIIIIGLGFASIFTIRESLQDRLRLDASIGEANCLMTEKKEGIYIGAYCENIKDFKIKGFNGQ